jgi:pimeloyl-ACP methyl ester carboxylesterase
VTDSADGDLTAVLVHGGFLGPWIWADVVRQLSRDGIRSVCVDLPSCQDTGPDLAGLADDVRAVRTVLDGCTSAVVCGHSYAGMVVSEAAAGHPAVRHLIYLAAAIPDAGDSLTSLAEASMPPADASMPPADKEEAGEGEGEEIEFRPDGRIMIRPDSARTSLFHDCDAARASDAIARLRPINPATSTETVKRAAWHDIPATYVRCTQDRLPYQPVSSSFLSRGFETRELPAGHCPQWSRPGLVASLIAGICAPLR